MLIKGKSDRPCFICGSTDHTREVKSDEFTGTLCAKHIVMKTDVPVAKKNGKKDAELVGAGAEE